MNESVFFKCFSNTSMLNTDIGEDIDGRDILIYDVFQFASDI